MTAGLRIIGNNGKLLLDSAMFHASFVGKGSVPASSFGESSPAYVGNPSAAVAEVNHNLGLDNLVIFLSSESTESNFYVVAKDANSFIIRGAPYPMPSRVYWYAFSVVVPTPTEYGLNLYNASGQCTYSSDYKIMQVVGTGTSLSDVSTPSGKTYAAMPTAKWHQVLIDQWNPTHGSVTGAVYGSGMGGGYNGVDVSAGYGGAIFDGWVKSVTGGGTEGSQWQTYGDENLPFVVIDVTGY